MTIIQADVYQDELSKYNAIFDKLIFETMTVLASRPKKRRVTVINGGYKDQLTAHVTTPTLITSGAGCSSIFLVDTNYLSTSVINSAYRTLVFIFFSVNNHQHTGYLHKYGMRAPINCFIFTSNTNTDKSNLWDLSRTVQL